MSAPDPLGRLDRLADGLAADLATGRSRRSFLGRVGAAVLAGVGARAVGAAVAPEDAEAFHFCGHIWTTGSCPHPARLPRVDRAGKPLRPKDGRPIDNLGRLVDAKGRPIGADGRRLRGPDGEPLPRAPRTRICEDWVRERHGLEDAVMQGSWYRCCDGQIRKLWDCCSRSRTRINGDASLVGYCYKGKRVFCVVYRDTNLPC